MWCFTFCGIHASSKYTAATLSNLNLSRMQDASIRSSDASSENSIADCGQVVARVRSYSDSSHQGPHTVQSECAESSIPQSSVYSVNSEDGDGFAMAPARDPYRVHLFLSIEIIDNATDSVRRSNVFLADCDEITSIYVVSSSMPHRWRTINVHPLPRLVMDIQKISYGQPLIAW